jgi:hypothetical protein
MEAIENNLLVPRNHYCLARLALQNPINLLVSIVLTSEISIILDQKQCPDLHKMYRENRSIP